MASRESKTTGQRVTELPGADDAPSGREQWHGKPAPSKPATPSRHVEIETKLEIDATTPLPDLSGRRSLTAVGLRSVAEPVVHELDAVYFDTEAFDLLRSKLTLRHRTGGDDAGWHLKLPAIARARTEIGLPLETRGGDPLDARRAHRDRSSAGTPRRRPPDGSGAGRFGRPRSRRGSRAAPAPGRPHSEP